MIGNIARASILAFAVIASTAGVAAASTPYDGRWSLSIVTQRGACDTYNFPVNITNGAVTFPGLVKASGRVAQGRRGSRECRRRRQVRVRLRQTVSGFGQRPLDRQVRRRAVLGHLDRAAVVSGAQPFTPSNSTSKISVAFGGMAPPAPRAP